MSKAFKWPKLPNSRPYLDKGYTSIQMREYAMKCIGEAIRNKQWIGLTQEERNDLYEKHHDEFCLPKQGSPDGFDYERELEAILKEKNCGQ